MRKVRKAHKLKPFVVEENTPKQTFKIKVKNCLPMFSTRVMEDLEELPFYEMGTKYSPAQLRRKDIKGVSYYQPPAECLASETVVEEPEIIPPPPIVVEDKFDESFEFFKRSHINKVVKKTKSLKTYSKLTNFLKCKFFMRARDHTLINTMVSDARIWMIKSGHTCESAEDFNIMTQAVIVSYMVNEQEMRFREFLKNEKNWDNMVHLNKTVAGDLGKVSLWKTYEENSRFSKFLPDLRFPRAAPVAV
jgi:hypothetical protein